MTLPKPRRTRIHLTCSDPHLLKAIENALFEVGYRLEKRAERAQVFGFVGNAQAFFQLESWRRSVSDALATRVAFMSGSLERISRMFQRGQLALMGVSNHHAQDFIARILGFLFDRDHLPSLNKVLVGQSQALRRMLEQIENCAQSSKPVLVHGESGCGKELCAQLLHDFRKIGDLHTINCASLSPQLIDSQLYGNVKGAYTGAENDRKGLLTEAGNGTCFLDEIGELQAASQANLLRLVEQNEIRPVGSAVSHPFEGRLVLATNRNLAEEAQAGRFRFDLYQRLLLRIEIPPLRERKEDIPLLIRHFLDELNEQEGKAVAMPDLESCFLYDWPGNVRELKNTVTRCYIQEARPGKPLPLDLSVQLSEQGQREAEAAAQAALETTRVSAGPDAPTSEAASEAMPTRGGADGDALQVPYYAARDTWPMLMERALRVMLQDLLRREGKVTQTVIERIGFSRSRIYREIKNLNLTSRGEDVEK